MRRLPLILAVLGAAALLAFAATALLDEAPALETSAPEPLERSERITGGPQPGRTPGGVGLPPPRVRLLQNIRNFSVRDLLLDDPGVPSSVKRTLDRCGRCGLDNPVYADLTRDLADDVVIPVLDRGGRTTDVFVYARRGDRIERIFHRHGAELAFDVTGRFFTRVRKLLVFDIVYAPDDRRCCPSETTISAYRWDGDQMRRIATRDYF